MPQGPAVCTMPVLGVILLSIIAATASAQTGDIPGEGDVDRLVERIIELRADVESLDSRLQTLKEEHENRMSSLARREGTLESERENQELRVEKLKRKLADVREATRSAGVANEELVPVLREAIDGARDYTERALPFKRGERLASLDELESRLESGALKPPRLANRLWSFHADEVRLTGESGIYRQPAEIDGDERLVDVARVGMMLLYFRTDDRQYGYAVPRGEGWEYHLAGDRGAEARIESLFDSLQKQVRTGFFRLPNPLSPETP